VIYYFLRSDCSDIHNEYVTSQTYMKIDLVIVPSRLSQFFSSLCAFIGLFPTFLLHCTTEVFSVINHYLKSSKDAVHPVNKMCCFYLQ
jgi:hypothetical protein